MTLINFGYNKLGIKPPLLLEATLLNKMTDGLPPEMFIDGELGANIKMVDGELRSREFESGVKGWRILGNGSIELEEGYFRGDISGASGSFTGSIEIGTGDDVIKGNGVDGFWVGNEEFANAPFSVELDGSAVVNNLTINGGVGIANLTDAGALAVLDGVGTNEIHNLAITGQKIANLTIGSSKINSLNADVIDAGTITGRTLIANGGAGIDIEIRNNGYLYFKYGGVTRAFVCADTGGNLLMDASDNIYLFADDSIYLSADQEFKVVASDDIILISEDDDVEIEAHDNLTLSCSQYEVWFNQRNNGDDCYWVSAGGSTRMRLSSGGNLTVDNNFFANGDIDCAGDKDFKIDHPAKEGYWLRHVTVESNDRVLLYKGRAKTKNKSATIELPDYFEILNKDFDYNLTPIGSLARLGIKTEVKDNKFEVMSDEDCEFSWVVYGIRNDKHSQDNPYQTEIKKKKTDKEILIGEKRSESKKSKKIKKNNFKKELAKSLK